MSEFLTHYLSIGIGFYIGLALQSPHRFMEARSADLLRGLLLGIPFWPMGMMIQIYFVLRKP